MFQKYKNEQLIATKILENSIINNKLSHAYIFETNNYPYAFELIVEFVKNILCKDDYDIKKEVSIYVKDALPASKSSPSLRSRSRCSDCR